MDEHRQADPADPAEPVDLAVGGDEPADRVPREAGEPAAEPVAEPAAHPGAPGAAADPAGEPPDVDRDAIDADTVTTTVLPVAGAAIAGQAAAAHDVLPGADTAIDEPTGHLASPAAEFPVVLRGYDRSRVDAVLDDLRDQLETAVARYETAEAALTASRGAAAAAQREAEQASREAQAARDELAGRISPANLSERIRRMLELAEEEAAATRAAASHDAEQMIAAARGEVAALQRRRAELDAELTRLHDKVTEMLTGGAAGAVDRR